MPLLYAGSRDRQGHFSSADDSNLHSESFRIFDTPDRVLLTKPPQLVDDASRDGAEDHRFRPDYLSLG
jgi:hypothetical protein